MKVVPPCPEIEVLPAWLGRECYFCLPLVACDAIAALPVERRAALGGTRLELLTAVAEVLWPLTAAPLLPANAPGAKALSARAPTKANVISLLFILSASLSKLIRVEWNSSRDGESVRQLAPANNARRIIRR